MAPCTLPDWVDSSVAGPAELEAEAICTAIGLPGLLCNAVSSHLPPDLHLLNSELSSTSVNEAIADTGKADRCALA